MKNLLILFTLLVFLLSPMAPAQAAGSPGCDYPAALALDGVDLDLCLPFALGAFQLPEPDNKNQVASATDAAGHVELSITAIPLGTRPGSESLPVLQPGQAEHYRTLLQEARLGQAAARVGSPQIRLFGRAVTGATHFLSLKTDGVHPQPVQISEWLTEAGGRIWLVRLIDKLPDGTSPAASPFGAGEITVSAQNPDAPSTSLASLKADAPAAPVELAAPQVALPTPGWWSGDCDTNNYQVKNGRPAYPLGASYLGMKACGPRYFDYPHDTLVFFFPGSWGEYEWECIELSARFLYLAYGVPPYNADANELVANYTGTRLVKVSNPTVGKAPQPGDVLSYNLWATSGHTSVVTATNVDASGNGTITIIEENGVASGTRSHPVSNWKVIDSQDISGWLHDPTHDSELPPTVTFSAQNPATKAWYNTNQTIAWTASDYIGLWGYSQAWDADPGGTAPQVITSAAGSADFSGLSEGQHTLYVRVWDNSPSHHSQVYTTGWYGYDITPPAASLSSFLEGETIVTRGLPLGVSDLTDGGGSGVQHTRITASWTGQNAIEVASGFITAGIYPWDLCLTGVPDGQPISVSLDVWDQAGNVSLAAGGIRHFVKNYVCNTPARVSLFEPGSLTPTFTGSANECTHYWKQFTNLNGHPAYLTLNADSAIHSTNSARWTPTLPAAGQYKVEALIPHHSLMQLCHIAAPSADTAKAQYQVHYQGGSTGVTVDQQAHSDEWVDLGTYAFAAGSTGSVELTDLTGETNLSRYVLFSEMRFTPLVAPQSCFGLNLGIFPANSASLTVTPPNCGGSQYSPGSVVQVTLTPQPGMTFSRWEGSQSGNANPLSITINADQALIAYLYYPHLIFLPKITH